MENKPVTTDALSDKQLIGYLDAMGLVSKLTANEKTQFLEISKAFGLNPFKREIFCSKYGDVGSGQMSIIVGYETYIKRAERSGQLDGWSVITEGKAEDNTLKAIITIHRKDRTHPFVHEVYYSEYVQKTKEGHVTKFWQKAYTMIKKVAMSQGFRLCFSDELGGLPYTKEEMPEQTDDVTFIEVVKEVMTPKQAIDLLMSSQNLTQLAENWGTVKEVGKDPDVIAAKEQMKVNLTPVKA